MAHPIRITPVGGLGEVGRNMTVVEHDDVRIVIDCGIGFPHGDDRGLGVDIFLPDVRVMRGKPVDAVLITHAHDDHVAALAHLLRSGTPIGRIVSLPFSIAMVEAKLSEHDLPVPPLVTAQPGELIEIGSVTAEFIRVTHSIPDPCAIALHTALGTVVHTGDYKLDATGQDVRRQVDRKRLTALGDAGVLAMLGDSTNAQLPGRTPSEATTIEPINDVIDEAPGRVILTSFSSQIDRIDHALRAADRTHRQVMLLGRSMRRNVKIAERLHELSPTHLPSLSRREIGGPKALVICTGSQAEEFAVLGRASRGEHPDLHIGNGDTVVYASRPVPGNEGPVEEMQNMLRMRGARVVTHHDAPIHVSGHARADEIAEMVRMLRPSVVIPVHGEDPMLRAQAEIAIENGVAADRVHVGQNGDVIELDGVGARVVDQIDAMAIPAGSDGLPLGAGEPG
ncbi:MAG: ribonuclease J [Gaiellales bacterium]